MFSLIEGGFQFAVDGLIELQLSWLFCFCGVVASNIVTVGIVGVKKIKARKNG